MYAAAFSPCADTDRMTRLPKSASPSLRMAGTKKTCDTPWAWISSAMMRAPDTSIVVTLSIMRVLDRADGDLPGALGGDVQVVVTGLDVVDVDRIAGPCCWDVDEMRQITHVAERRLGIG